MAARTELAEIDVSNDAEEWDPKGRLGRDRPQDLIDSRSFMRGRSSQEFASHDEQELHVFGRLRHHSVPAQGGANLADAVRAALKDFRQERGQVVHL